VTAQAVRASSQLPTRNHPAGTLSAAAGPEFKHDEILPLITKLTYFNAVNRTEKLLDRKHTNT